jgi:chromosome segregation ATPase
MATPESTRPGAPEASLESALLDRLERQVAELTELKTRVKSLEGALEAERKTRSEMSDRLTAERERVRKLEEDLQAQGEEEVAELREKLAHERQTAVALGSQLEQAWTQLNDLKPAPRPQKGPFRRKHG